MTPSQIISEAIWQMMPFRKPRRSDAEVAAEHVVTLPQLGGYEIQQNNSRDGQE